MALLLSEWMENKVVEWKEVSSRLMWVRVRMGRECWTFVSAYGLGCERSEEERDEFWNDLTRCVDGLSTRNYVVVLGDLNARVGDGEVEGVVGKYGVPGENESGERLLDMCVEQELVIGNSFFKKKKWKSDRKCINGLCVDNPYITVGTATFSYKTFLTFIPSPLFFITPCWVH